MLNITTPMVRKNISCGATQTKTRVSIWHWKAMPGSKIPLDQYIISPEIYPLRGHINWTIVVGSGVYRLWTVVQQLEFFLMFTPALNITGKPGKPKESRITMNTHHVSCVHILSYFTNQQKQLNSVGKKLHPWINSTWLFTETENGFLEPKYLDKEVIIHPNHKTYACSYI